MDHQLGFQLETGRVYENRIDMLLGLHSSWSLPPSKLVTLMKHINGEGLIADINPGTDSVGTFLWFRLDMCPFEDRLIQQTSLFTPF